MGIFQFVITVAGVTSLTLQFFRLIGAIEGRGWHV